MLTTIMLVLLTNNLGMKKFRKLTQPVEAFTGEMWTVVETSQVKPCAFEATCVTVVRSE